MTAGAIMSRLHCSRLWRRFRDDSDGVAAIEFAMVLPLLLLVYVGMVNVAQMVMVNRKVTQLTLALSDLTARVASVPTSEIANIFNASETILMPYDSSKAKMMIASVVIDASRVARVCWISTFQGAKDDKWPVRGDTVVLPDSVRVASTSVIMARATYAFSLPVSDWILNLFGGTETKGSITLGGNPIYTRPRKGVAEGDLKIEQVVRTDVGACPKF